jgi:hypothetical protein
MERTEETMVKIETNHLTHIQTALEVLVNDTDRTEKAKVYEEKAKVGENRL